MRRLDDEAFVSISALKNFPDVERPNFMATVVAVFENLHSVAAEVEP